MRIVRRNRWKENGRDKPFAVYEKRERGYIPGAKRLRNERRLGVTR
jgi:hypothetical protein